jgi:hypothetical protein
MFDIARIVALVVAGAACIRPKYLLGFAVVLALAVLDAPSMVLPIVHRGQGPPNAFYALVLVFWGPSGMPMPPTSSEALNALGDHPVARTAMSSSLGFVAATVAFRRAKPLRPETLEARSWDRVGLRFLFVAVFDALLVASGAMVTYLVRE